MPRNIMKTSIRSILALSLVWAASSTVWAHDPAEHAKEAAAKKAKADCASMQKMDMSKMNMDDPVMQAMHSKCAKQMRHSLGWTCLPPKKPQKSGSVWLMKSTPNGK
jgi:uncharacterized protein involved in copper resistance